MPIVRNTVDSRPAHAANYLGALGICALATVITLPLRSVLDLANIVMIFLLGVLLVAVRMGRGPAIMTAFLSVALFDFFFVPPHLSFAVEDIQYLVTFAVMLSVGLVTAHLTARLTEQRAEARQSERATHDLYEVASGMAGAINFDQVVALAQRYLADRQLKGQVLLSGADGVLLACGPTDHTLGRIEHGFAEAAYQRNEIVEADSLAGSGIAIAFVPLRASGCVRGILAIAPMSDDVSELRQNRPALETLASLIALAVERLHYVEAAQVAELQISEERLRSSVLSSLSHDLRTPLTTLVGLADSMSAAPASSDPAAISAVASIIRDQAQAMHKLLTNVLDMARLQGGKNILHKEWQSIGEIIGSSLRLMGPSLGSRQIRTSVDPSLPLVECDAVLIERVLCNLLDNAAKFSPPSAHITISATIAQSQLVVSVTNSGSTLPSDRITQLFQVFVRGVRESAIPGVGLGLTICKTIIQAHGGEITAENNAEGVCASFTLPLGTPPLVEEDVD